VPVVPGVPSAGDLAALPHAEMAVRLAEAYRMIAVLAAQAQELSAQVLVLQVRVAELERQAARDSSTSLRPPSSDSPYKKKQPQYRSPRERGKRRPGKQPGEPAVAQRRHQVTDIAPAPGAEGQGGGRMVSGGGSHHRPDRAHHGYRRIRSQAGRQDAPVRASRTRSSQSGIDCGYRAPSAIVHARSKKRRPR
jgi:hypothetical protein